MGINGIDGQFPKLNSVEVTRWGTAAADGVRRDCLWNIAADQAGAGASNQDIWQIMEEIIAYNDEKAGTQFEIDTTIHAGEQILIPLEYAMDEIQQGVAQETEKCNVLSGQLILNQGALFAANLAVGFAEDAFNGLQEQLNGFDDSQDNSAAKQGLQDRLAEAEESYKAALENQQKALEDYEQTQKDLNESKATLDAYKLELEGLKQEHQDKTSETDTKVQELQAEIEKIDGSINVAQNLLESEQAKLMQENAQEQQQDGIEDGIIEPAPAADEAAPAAEAGDGEANADGDTTGGAAGIPQDETPGEQGAGGDNAGDAQGTPVTAAELDENEAKYFEDIMGNAPIPDDIVETVNGNTTTYTFTDNEGNTVEVTTEALEGGGIDETGRIVTNENGSTEYAQGEGNTTLVTQKDRSGDVLSETTYNQEYTKPEDLRKVDITEKIEYTTDDLGNEITSTITYNENQDAVVTITRAGLEPIEVTEAYYKANGAEAITRQELINELKGNEIYDCVYLGRLLDDYNESALPAGSTDGKINAAQKLEQYKAAIDSLNEASSGDSVYAEQLRSNNVIDEFQNDLSYGRFPYEEAIKVSNARLQILEKQAEFIEQYNEAYGKFEDLSPTQQLALCNTGNFLEEIINKMHVAADTNILGATVGSSVKYPDLLNNISDINSIRYDDNFEEDLNGYVDAAIQNFDNKINIITEYTDAINVDEPKTDTGYSDESIESLKGAYDLFMGENGPWQKAENSWWGVSPDIILCREEAEAILSVAYTGEGAISGRLQIDTVIQNLNRYNFDNFIKPEDTQIV